MRSRSTRSGKLAHVKTGALAVVTPDGFPLRLFVDGNMPAMALIRDLRSVGLEIGTDAQGFLWLRRRRRRKS